MRFLAALLLFAFAAPARAEPVKVVASFSILGDLVRQVGGDRVWVVELVGPGGDPHGFEPRPSDARKLAGASLLVVNGLGFDPWADRLAIAAGFHGARVVAGAKVVPILHGKAPDPHGWQSASNVLLYVDAIVAGLIEADPAEARAFKESGAAYAAKLKDLDREIRAAMESIPAERRRAIVPHDAFAYYGREYGVEFLAPLGTDADAEPTASRTAELAEMVRAGKVRALFAEHLEDHRLVDRIAAEAGARIEGELYSDALTPPGGPAGTYIEMMRANLRVLRAGLESAPAAPRPR